MKKYDSLIQR